MESWYHLIGTSHVARTTTRIINHAVKELNPDAIAVELDPQRLGALLHGGKQSYSPRLIRIIGIRGYLFALIGAFVQRRLGKIVNVTPGTDMLAAVKAAQREKKRLILIDRDIGVTLQRLNKALGWKEVKQTFKDIWNGLVKRERLQINLSTIPDEKTVIELIGILEDRYPRPYRALVHERNVHMVKALQKYHDDFPHHKVLVVVGMGHVPGMRKLFSQQKNEQ